MIWESSKLPFPAGFCQTQKHDLEFHSASYEETITNVATEDHETEIMAWLTCQSCHDEMVGEYTKEIVIEKRRNNSAHN